MGFFAVVNLQERVCSFTKGRQDFLVVVGHIPGLSLVTLVLGVALTTIINHLFRKITSLQVMDTVPLLLVIAVHVVVTFLHMLRNVVSSDSLVFKLLHLLLIVCILATFVVLYVLSQVCVIGTQYATHESCL